MKGCEKKIGDHSGCSTGLLLHSLLTKLLNPKAYTLNRGCLPPQLLNTVIDAASAGNTVASSTTLGDSFKRATPGRIKGRTAYWGYQF